MASQPFGSNVTKVGGGTLAVGVALVLVISLLKDFGLVDITQTIGSILTIVAVLFIFAETGVELAFKKMSVVKMLVLVVGGLAFIGAVAGLFGWTIGILVPIMGVLKAVLAILFIWSVFT